MLSIVLHSEKTLVGGYLLAGIELIGDWLLKEGVGRRKRTLGAGIQVRGLRSDPSSMGQE